MEHLKIAFSGATSTGKTTIIRQLLEKYPQYKHIPSPARKALASGFSINENGTDLTQYNIFGQHISNFHTNITDICLFDRCVLDSMAFTHYALEEQKVSTDCGICCGEITNSLIHKYNAIFLCRPFGKIIEDGIRSNDLEFQKKIDNLMIETANIFNVKLIHLEGNEQERLSIVESTIEQTQIIHKTFPHEYPRT